VLRVVEFPPEVAIDPADNARVLAEMGLAPPSGGRRAPIHSHMHATDSVDYAIVIEGEIDMLLDDSEVHLNTGDIMVQQGTNHAWVNRSDRPCKIAFVLIDATGAPIVPAG
jgi:quercetin dioxygenase-like cupin family protein